jgi:hypothetical protein
MLTGKNREQFIDWLHQHMVTQAKGVPFRFIEQFNNLPLSMQFGVVQDYADSIGYDVNALKSLNDEMNGYVYVSSVNDNCINDTHKTRDEARKAAIKAFDEIVNAE